MDCGRMAGVWTCSICSGVFHELKAFEKHWEFEMELAFDDSLQEVRRAHARPENKFKINSGGRGDEQQKKIKFRSCFEPIPELAAVPEARAGKRSFSAACFDTRQCCPICNKSFNPVELQRHVEEELASMEQASGSSSRPQHGMQRSAPRTPAAPGVLVLGDVPEPRKRFKGVKEAEQLNESRFNHYADGKGWWDESSLGIEFSNVELSWEGFGSVTFAAGEF